jgi:hypothetical protein
MPCRTGEKRPWSPRLFMYQHQPLPKSHYGEPKFCQFALNAPPYCRTVRLQVSFILYYLKLPIVITMSKMCLVICAKSSWLPIQGICSSCFPASNAAIGPNASQNKVVSQIRSRNPSIIQLLRSTFLQEFQNTQMRDQPKPLPRENLNPRLPGAHPHSRHAR